MDDQSTVAARRPACRLYADENFPLRVVQELRKLGHDVSTVQEAGQGSRGIPDDLVLSFAHSEQRAIITHNRGDFIHLHRQSPDHSGIIVCTEDKNHAAVASRIDSAISSLDSLIGELVRITRPSG